MLKTEIFIYHLNLLELDLVFSIDVEFEIGNLLINNHINELNNLRVQLELILIKQ